MVSRCALLALSVMLTLCACATHRISTATKAVGSDVASFQGSLSTLQDEWKNEQDDERGIIGGTAARRDAAAAVTRQMQVEWAVASSKNGSDLFATLQIQGREAATAALAPSASPAQPTSVSLPIDKLSAVSKTLDQLSKGATRQADVESLVNYGIAINQQLQTIEKQAKAPAKTPAAPVAAGK
jgi:hypothetical protein